jgi:mannosyl-oligosaccharide alpha-1,2-mannosidase
MLPLHVRESPPSPLKSHLPFTFGFRWVIWVFVSIVFLWISGTFLFRFAPTPVHSYVPSVDNLFNEGRPRPSHPAPFGPPLPPRPPPPPVSPRAVQVRDAFVHAYSGYKNQAFPYDELLPIDGGKVNK